mgnify:CR=1 FL=1
MHWHYVVDQPSLTAAPLLTDGQELGYPCRRARNDAPTVLVRRRQTLDYLVLHMQAFFLELPELFIGNVSG